MVCFKQTYCTFIGFRMQVIQMKMCRSRWWCRCSIPECRRELWSLNLLWRLPKRTWETGCLDLSGSHPPLSTYIKRRALMIHYEVRGQGNQNFAFEPLPNQLFLRPGSGPGAVLKISYWLFDDVRIFLLVKNYGLARWDILNTFLLIDPQV